MDRGRAGDLPQIEFSVSGHDEEHSPGHDQKHTMYAIQCRISCELRPCLPISWTCKKRLADLRGSLHDPVKAALPGGTYDRVFGDAPFARHGGVKGTTARLKAWMATLAEFINSGDCPLAVSALVVRFLDPPKLDYGGLNVVDDENDVEYLAVYGFGKIRLGMVVHPCKNGFIIEAYHPGGLFHEWVNQNPGKLRGFNGIIEVNGFKEDPYRMIVALKTRDVIDMTLRTRALQREEADALRERPDDPQALIDRRDEFETADVVNMVMKSTSRAPPEDGVQAEADAAEDPGVTGQSGAGQADGEQPSRYLFL